MNEYMSQALQQRMEYLRIENAALRKQREEAIEALGDVEDQIVKPLRVAHREAEAECSTLRKRVAELAAWIRKARAALATPPI